jgi:uncharacterized protein (DUF2147 family)
MKKLVLFTCLFYFSVCLCFGLDPAEGFWINVDRRGNATEGWEVYAVDGILHAKILSVAGHPQDVIASRCNDSYPNFPLPGIVSKMTVVGTPWIFGLAQDGPGSWSGEHIVDPLNGRMYKCNISFHPQDGNRYNIDTLEVRGEIGLGIGLSQYWRKSSREQASSLR